MKKEDMFIEDKIFVWILKQTFELAKLMLRTLPGLIRAVFQGVVALVGLFGRGVSHLRNDMERKIERNKAAIAELERQIKEKREELGRRKKEDRELLSDVARAWDAYRENPRRGLEELRKLEALHGENRVNEALKKHLPTRSESRME